MKRILLVPLLLPFCMNSMDEKTIELKKVELTKTPNVESFEKFEIDLTSPNLGIGNFMARSIGRSILRSVVKRFEDANKTDDTKTQEFPQTGTTVIGTIDKTIGTIDKTRRPNFIKITNRINNSKSRESSDISSHMSRLCIKIPEDKSQKTNLSTNLLLFVKSNNSASIVDKIAIQGNAIENLPVLMIEKSEEVINYFDQKKIANQESVDFIMNAYCKDVNYLLSRLTNYGDPMSDYLTNSEKAMKFYCLLLLESKGYDIKVLEANHPEKFEELMDDALKELNTFYATQL